MLAEELIVFQMGRTYSAQLSLKKMVSFLEMGLPAEKIRKIPYCVRLERFRPIGHPPEGCFEVLFAGGVSLRKGESYSLNRRKDVAGAGKITVRLLSIYLAKRELSVSARDQGA